MRTVGQNNVPSFGSRAQLLNWFYEKAGIPRWPAAERLRQKPTYWGKYVWSLIHGAGLLVRDETDRRSFVQWMYTYPGMLPCKTCASSFGVVLRKIPNQRINANVYAMRLHEAVNHKLERPALSYPNGDESWLSTLTRQNLLNNLPLDQIPVPEQQETPQQRRQVSVRPRSTVPIISHYPHHTPTVPIAPTEHHVPHAPVRRNPHLHNHRSHPEHFNCPNCSRR